MSTATHTFRNTVDELSRLAAFVDAFARAHALSALAGNALNVALDELLTNIVFHAFSDDDDHEIRVTLAFAEGVIRATIADDGIPFDPTRAPAPPPLSSDAEGPVGGLGLPLVRKLVDELTYERVDDRNVTTFTQTHRDA